MIALIVIFTVIYFQSYNIPFIYCNFNHYWRTKMHYTRIKRKFIVYVDSEPGIANRFAARIPILPGKPGECCKGCISLGYSVPHKSNAR